MSSDITNEVLDYTSKLGGFSLFLNYSWFAEKTSRSKNAFNSAFQVTFTNEPNSNPSSYNKCYNELDSVCNQIAEYFIEDLGNLPNLQEVSEKYTKCCIFQYIESLKVASETNSAYKAILNAACDYAMEFLQDFIDYLKENDRSLLSYTIEDIAMIYNNSTQSQEDHNYYDFEKGQINQDQLVMEQEGTDPNIDNDAEMGHGGDEDSNVLNAYSTFFDKAKTEFTSRIRGVVQGQTIQCLTIEAIKNFMQNEQLKQNLPTDGNFYYNMLWNALKQYRLEYSSQNLSDIKAEDIVQNGRIDVEFTELPDIVKEKFPIYSRIFA